MKRFNELLRAVRQFPTLFIKFCVAVALCCCCYSASAAAGPMWSTKFDGDVRFYQQTELGALIIGTADKLYAVEGATGEILWRRKNVRLNETDIAPVPGTDLLLLTLEKDKRSRIEAVDMLTGDTLWQSEKVRGAVGQMAVDVDAHLLAIVTVRDTVGRAADGLKRKPVVYALDLTTGEQRWKYEVESDVELMPLRWSERQDDKTEFTLDNYRPPLFLDRRLYLFYEGVTTLDAYTGKQIEREKFRVNEENLALTEADAIANESFLFTTGRGKVRAVARASGEVAWEAKDLGLTPEMFLTTNALYVRTGGQFTDIRKGETVARGSYGVSALETRSGKVLWRYKGADKGITNIVLADANTLLLADRDDLIALDAATGKRTRKVVHRVKDAAFVLLNERGQAVVGGTESIAAFDWQTGREVWRAHHNPPGRGTFRTIVAVAARAASLYFRYGGLATTAFRGAQLVRSANAFRWSGLAARASSRDLTSLATSFGQQQVAERVTFFGAASRLKSNAPVIRPRIARPSGDIDERLLDRLDPATQLERLAKFLWRRERLAALRGSWMYFYTDLPDEKQHGLIGINIHTGRAERAIPFGEADDRFIADEITGLLFFAKDKRAFAYRLNP